MSERRSVAVFDIDGVLADTRHRLHHVAQRPKNWNAFFAAADRDPLLELGAAFAHELATGSEIVYVTGRPESMRRQTTAWLQRSGLPTGRLHMRRADDRRPATVVKSELWKVVQREGEIGAIVDDDDAVIAVARAAGLPVLHADWMRSGAGSVPTHSAHDDAQQHDDRT